MLGTYKNELFHPLESYFYSSLGVQDIRALKGICREGVYGSKTGFNIEILTSHCEQGSFLVSILRKLNTAPV
jgi:hypothetical protein